MRRCVALFALLLVPQLVSAGPIEWTYSARLRTAGGTELLDLGTVTLGHYSEGMGHGEWITDEYTLTLPQPEQTATGTGTGRQVFPIFSFGSGLRVHPVAEAPAADREFLLDFTLTDTASGASGTIAYTGTAGASVLNERDNLRPLFSAGVDQESAELMLGGRRYRITTERSLPGDIEESAQLWFTVDAVQETPEPGTLLLAAVGLGAVGVRRMRKS